MAIAKTAGGIILAGWIAASGAQFHVLHEHLRKGCEGTMTADEKGIRFSAARGHAWAWTYDDIRQLRLEPGKIHILTYEDRRLRLGADREYDFKGNLPVSELYQLWTSRMDQRFVAALPAPGAAGLSIPVKHLKHIRGSEGTLVFGADSVVYSAGAADSHTWRYSDIDSISSSGPFQLTITTFERAPSQYGDRKGFNFELREPISEARYNEIWLQIEKKNGRIQ
jgi:hypothetical protein